MALKDKIEQAIADHAAWKSKFRDFINGRLELDISTVGLVSQCRFGKWLDNEGERMLLPRATHDEIFGLHAEFHRIAAEVAKKITSGDTSGAMQYLAPNGKFTRASSALMQRMLKINIASFEFRVGNASVQESDAT